MNFFRLKNILFPVMDLILSRKKKSPLQKNGTSKKNYPVRKKQKDPVSEALRELLWDFKKDNYHEYLKSDAWQAKRQIILKRAGYKCRQCGDRATEIHHETYERIYNEHLSDLTALCRKCHQARHTR